MFCVRVIGDRKNKMMFSLRAVSISISVTEKFQNKDLLLVRYLYNGCARDPWRVPGKTFGVEFISFKVENFPVFTEKSSGGGCFSRVFKAALFPMQMLIAASHTSYSNSFFKNLWHWMQVYQFSDKDVLCLSYRFCLDIDIDSAFWNTPKL